MVALLCVCQSLQSQSTSSAVMPERRVSPQSAAATADARSPVQDGVPLYVMPDARLAPLRSSAIPAEGSSTENSRAEPEIVSQAYLRSRTAHSVIGAVIGAIGGVAYAIAMNRQCDARQHSNGIPCGVGGAQELAILVFGAGGAVVGGLVGYLLPSSP